MNNPDEPVPVFDLMEIIEKVAAVQKSHYHDNPTLEQPRFFVFFREGQLMRMNRSGAPEILVESDEPFPLTEIARISFMSDYVGADRFVMVSEAWLSYQKMPKGTSAEEAMSITQDIVPSEDPNRVEVLMLYGGDREGRRVTLTLEFLRNEDGTFREFREFGRVDGGDMKTRWDLWNL